MNRIVAILALAAVTVFVGRAQAQYCNSYCGRYESGECVETVYTPCATPNTGPTNSYGAIAYGRTSRAYGYS